MDNNNNNNNLGASSIFNKYLNNKYKLLSFNVRKTYIGITKYLPPVSKEWKNTVYVFNPNKIKNLPFYDININLLIKNFFFSYLNPKYIFNKLKYRKNRYLSVNKIYVSKAEIKHMSNKAIMTVYVYNREKISILKRIKLLKRGYFKQLILLNSNYSKVAKVRKILNLSLEVLRKYKLMLNLNKSKFEEKLLFKLNNLIMKLYNKKVEFNIISMKSIIFNTDFFTKLLYLKLKGKKINVIRMMGVILNKTFLPEMNKIFEKSPVIKGVNINIISNKLKKNNISSILKDNEEDTNLSQLLNRLYYNVTSNNNLSKNYAKIYEIIFNNIKYKNIGGIKLEAKGRLTPRYRADRSVFKVSWKGGLKNIDSSYKRLSTVNMRGYVEPNIDYSLVVSKRRIGAFAIKGWVSAK